jgi:hypothetical protein
MPWGQGDRGRSRGGPEDDNKINKDKMINKEMKELQKFSHMDKRA